MTLSCSPVAGVVAAAAAAVVSAVPGLQPSAAAVPPWGSGPWWDVSENPSSSLCSLGAGGLPEALPHLVQLYAVGRGDTSSVLQYLLAGSSH